MFSTTPFASLKKPQNKEANKWKPQQDDLCKILRLAKRTSLLQQTFCFSSICSKKVLFVKLFLLGILNYLIARSVYFMWQRGVLWCFESCWFAFPSVKLFNLEEACLPFTSCGAASAPLSSCCGELPQVTQCTEQWFAVFSLWQKTTDFVWHGTF